MTGHPGAERKPRLLLFSLKEGARSYVFMKRPWDPGGEVAPGVAGQHSIRRTLGRFGAGGRVFPREVNQCFLNRVKSIGIIGSNRCGIPFGSGRWRWMKRRIRCIFNMFPFATGSAILDRSVFSLIIRCWFPTGRFIKNPSLVFVRPHACGRSDLSLSDRWIFGRQWCEQLSQLEAYLQNRPIPMKIVYVPENIGVRNRRSAGVSLRGPGVYAVRFSDRDTFRRVLLGKKEGKHLRTMTTSSNLPPKRGRPENGFGGCPCPRPSVLSSAVLTDASLQRFEVKPVPARTVLRTGRGGSAARRTGC